MDLSSPYAGKRCTAHSQKMPEPHKQLPQSIVLTLKSRTGHLHVITSWSSSNSSHCSCRLQHSVPATFIFHTKYVDIKPVPFVHQMLGFLHSSHPPRTSTGQVFPLGLPDLDHLIHKLHLAARNAAASSVKPPLLQPLNAVPSQMLLYILCPSLQLPCLPNKLSGSLTFHFASLHLLYSSWSLSSSLSWLDFPLPCSLAQRTGLPCLLFHVYQQVTASS